MKLNLGCGDRIEEGYVNIDLEPLTGVNLVFDINNTLPYENEEIDEILLNHSIEHIWWFNLKDRLNDWFRVLKKGGKLEIWTVNFEELIKTYQRDMFMLNWKIFNRNRFEGDNHKVVLTPNFLRDLLVEIGFAEVRLLNLSEYRYNEIPFNFGIKAIK